MILLNPEHRSQEQDPVTRLLAEPVSASRLNLFHCCRLKFYFRYVLKLSKPASPALHVGKTLIPVLGLHHVVLDAEFFQPTVQVEPKRTRLITGHHVTGELLLFNYKEQELVVGHLLHGLWSRPVDLTAYPVILGVGVNTEFDGVVGGG